MCGQKSVAKGLTREEVFRAVVRSRERVQAASNPQSPCQVEGPKTTFERIGERRHSFCARARLEQRPCLGEELVGGRLVAAVMLDVAAEREQLTS